jgi:hypothetical protein
MRSEPEIRDKLESLKETEQEFPNLPTNLNKLILRAQIKGLLFALGEEKDFRVTGD